MQAPVTPVEKDSRCLQGLTQSMLERPQRLGNGIRTQPDDCSPGKVADAIKGETANRKFELRRSFLDSLQSIVFLASYEQECCMQSLARDRPAPPRGQQLLDRNYALQGVWLGPQRKEQPVPW